MMPLKKVRLGFIFSKLYLRSNQLLDAQLFMGSEEQIHCGDVRTYTVLAA